MRSAIAVGLSLLFSAVALSVAAPSHAVPITGGTTTVEITGGAGDDISLSLLGSASFDLLGRAVFPVTGGDADLAALTGSIEHDGSGIALSVTTSGIDRTVQLQNFVIDLDAGTLAADATFLVDGMVDSMASDFLVFDVRSCLLSGGSDPCLDAADQVVMNGFGLRFGDGVGTAVAEFLFADAQPGDISYVTNQLEGRDFGIANVRLQVQAPEPATAGLLILGLGGLWVSGRRRVRR